MFDEFCDAKRGGASGRLPRSAIAATAVQCLLWSFGATLFISSLHPDTLQIIFWGRNLALGYPKHPPLASWILAAILSPGNAPILRTLVLGAACVAISAAFVWASARLVADRATAAVATLVYLASPAANAFAIQVNHNSLLVPFWSATLYFALRYFVRGESRDAALLGVVAGFGMITKYEMAFLLATLFLAALVEPSYRPLFRRKASYFAALLFFVVCAPHLAWLVGHANESLRYAIDKRPMTTMSDGLASLNNLFVGHLVLALGPAFAWLVASLSGFRLRCAGERRRLALVLAFGPSLFLVLASLGFREIIRQGWTLPFAPSLAIGAAMALRVEGAASARRFAILASTLAGVQFLAFVGFLAGRAAIGRPIGDYDLASRQMAASAQKFWNAHSHRKLKCLIVDDVFVSAAPVLWLRSAPQVVQLNQPPWSGPRRLAACLQGGALAIALGKRPPQRKGLRFCPDPETIRVLSPLSQGRFGWTATLAYAPPGDALDRCAAPPPGASRAARPPTAD